MEQHRRTPPVVEGWFTEGTGPDFRLLGTRCRDCGSVFFPREDSFCRNPACAGADLDEFPLSRTGHVWSYTDARYRTPPPYPSDPGRAWQPYTLVAVELADERMVVLGQAAPGVTPADLAVGMPVELVPGVLGETAADGTGGADTGRGTWNWRPVGGAR
ncbi:Zn-ribbon domain-containing OB-fold protein [Streptomyces sp. NPDC093221]|uniref:Zn-ribbon domain-containing OB-fold protein n=1 Tax=Streptomyces sp. NPDC093221 TaxID=3366032 RepID=UPI00380CB895